MRRLLDLGGGGQGLGLSEEGGEVGEVLGRVEAGELLVCGAGAVRIREEKRRGGEGGGGKRRGEGREAGGRMEGVEDGRESCRSLEVSGYIVLQARRGRNDEERIGWEGLRRRRAERGACLRTRGNSLAKPRKGFALMV